MVILIFISYQAFSSVDFRVIYKGHPDYYPVFSNRKTEAPGIEMTWLKSPRNKSAPFSTPVSYQLTQTLSNPRQPRGDLMHFPRLAALGRV